MNIELLPGADIPLSGAVAAMDMTIMMNIQTVQFVWRVAMNLESIVSVDILFTLAV